MICRLRRFGYTIREVLEHWRCDYNEQRPHSELGRTAARDYALTLLGKAGRGAALRQGSARRASWQPTSTKFKSSADSSKRWMKDGGHFTHPALEDAAEQDRMDRSTSNCSEDRSACERNASRRGSSHEHIGSGFDKEKAPQLDDHER